MPELYERLGGVHATLPKIPVHAFQAAAAEWARGNITGVQANAIVTATSGQALGATGQQEAQDLVDTVIPGATALLKAERALRIQEIDQVLLLVDARVAPYNDPAAVRTRLGVLTR